MSAPDVTLVAFTPAGESGWVRADLAPDLSSPGSPIYRVSPVIGWAHLEDADGEDYILAVDNYGQWDPELHSAEVYFSRRLFREAQRGSLVLSRPALLARASD